MTRLVAEKQYKHLDQQDMLSEEQKVARRKRETMRKTVQRKCKLNLHKACDVVLYQWWIQRGVCVGIIRHLLLLNFIQRLCS